MEAEETDDVFPEQEEEEKEEEEERKAEEKDEGEKAEGSQEVKTEEAVSFSSFPECTGETDRY